MANRRNSALQYFVNGRRAQSLHGLADGLGNPLDAYDTAVVRAIVGLRRRALPAVSRAVRANYSVKASELTGKYRVETELKGRRGDRDESLSIWASTRGISLIHFGGRWRGRKSPGATAAIAKGGAKTYASAFIATVQGRKAIRVRQFESTGRRAPRGPLRMLRGPSPFEMLSGLDHRPSLATKDAVLQELTTFYTGELRRQFRLARS